MKNTKTYLGFDSGTNNAAAKQVGLEDYEKMVVEADNEVTDVSNVMINMLLPSMVDR